MRRLLATLFIPLLLAGTGAGTTPAISLEAGTFAVVSDIHFNPFDDPDLARNLADAPPESWGAILNSGKARPLAGRGQDTNQPLLASALMALTAQTGGADFAIVSGDLLAHRFEQKAAGSLGTASSPELVQALAGKTALYVAGALRAALPGRPVLVALGNNDSDCGDYAIEPGGPFLTFTRETVRNLAGPDHLGSDFEETYAAGGYYGLRHPTVPDADILVLNDVLWSAEYRDACGSGGDAAADAMLSWLGERLRAAQGAGRRVWLVHHIPVGIDPYATLRSANDLSCPARTVPLLREPYASGFTGLLRAFAPVIQANFSGHTHQDSYRLVRDAGGPMGVEKMAPSISPIFGNNPGFHVFDYDRQSGNLRDFSTWYLANLQDSTRGAPPEWRREYVFTQAYDQPDYSPASVARLTAGLAIDGSPAREAFQSLYGVSRGQIGAAAMPAQICAIGNLDPASFSACHCGG
ncbi:metallophosphoesterase [Microvirga pudoricolor]|uniref:metallophosphoesterase n=1 Tax=Microvirga pudoricolor TaxID=2778729 RepID=UPI001950951E|nr:metallophosphoesterase [Microvirga pudoricolor]MBM6596144.1 metallophosphoesterase [Microvirga pudoricolor]